MEVLRRVKAQMRGPGSRRKALDDTSTPSFLSDPQEIKLTFEARSASPTMTTTTTTTTSSSSSSSRLAWMRQLPKFQIEVRTGARSTCVNEVFRSNSFKFERCHHLGHHTAHPHLDTHKIVEMSEHYHTPRDLVHRGRLPVVSEESSLSSSSMMSVRDCDSSSASWRHSDLSLAANPYAVGRLEATYSDPCDSKLYTEPGDDLAKVYVGPDEDADEALHYMRPYHQHRTRGVAEDKEKKSCSIYEDVGKPVEVSNKRSNANCVTIITVGTESRGRVKSSVRPLRSSVQEPLYENLDFHRVHPVQEGELGEEDESQRRRPRGSVVVDCRVVKKSGGGGHALRIGYSPCEVWNWLYTDNEVQMDAKESKKGLGTRKERLLSTSSCVHFSPNEFVDASERLAPLDLDGLESFVGNTLQRNLKRCSVTVTEVPASSPLDVKVATNSSSSAVSSLSSSGSNSSRSCGSETLGQELNESGKQGSSKSNKPSGKACNGSQSTLLQPPIKPDRKHTTAPYQVLEVGRGGGSHEHYNELYAQRAPSMRQSDSGSQSPWPSCIDTSIPLERQEWFHGAVTRVEAETVLRLHCEGSFLVRNSESARQDYSLSLKSSRGFMHMRIQRHCSGQFVLGQFSRPFESVPNMVAFYVSHRLPIKGAEHMCLLYPICEQLL